MRSRSIVMSALLASAAAIGCAVASATPGVGGSSAAPVIVDDNGEPVIGRVRTRDQVIDLTSSSLTAGGAARDLIDGYARPVHADIDSDLRKSQETRDPRAEDSDRGAALRRR